MIVTFDQITAFIRALAEFGTFGLLLYTAIIVREVKHATNSLLDKRVEAAEQVGHGRAMEEVRVEKREDEKKG